MPILYCYKCGRPAGDSRLRLDYSKDSLLVCNDCNSVDELFAQTAARLTTRNSFTEPSKQNSQSHHVPDNKTSKFDKTFYFTNCGLEFPSVTFCGKVFNDILKQGLSLNQLEEKYKRLSRSTIKHTSSWKISMQYTLQTDIWGPKEIVMIFKDGPDHDACVVYGIRNGNEFITVDNFLKHHPKVQLLEHKPGNRTYCLKFTNHSESRTAQVIINLLRETEQTAKVTLLITF